MALRTADDDPNKNIGQRHSDNQFNALKKAESAGTTNSSIKDSSAGSENINNAEENPSGDWQNNVSGTKPSSSKSGGRFGFIKKKGPLTAIILTLVGGGLGIGGLLSPALMMQSILANLVQKFNLQETSLAIRTDKLISRKIAGEATNGYCSNIIKVSILCKFTRPSNRFLDKLKTNGIDAIDAKGNLINKSTFLPNGRPAAYKYIDNAGKQVTVDATKLYDKFVEDAAFRNSFHSASNSRFMSLTDNVFQAIKKRFGFRVTDKLKNSKGVDDVTAKLESEEAEGLAEKGAVKAEKEGLEKLASKEIIKVSQKLIKTAKGPVIIAGIACTVANAPGLISKISTTFQMTQLIRYSSTFLSAFGAIKAGDATPEEVSAVGDTLTKVVDNKSAMDSFGMNYAINNDLDPVNDNYKKFDPTNSVVSDYRTINGIASGVSGGCDTAIKKLGEGLNIVTFGLSNWVTRLMSSIIEPAVSTIVAALPLDKALDWVMGDITADIQGEDVGNAITSGASHLMGQTANAGGNMPLTPKEAVAYNNLTNKVQLAYAEEDRATKSPFDISSPNTMLGSIFQKVAPYYFSSGVNAGSLLNNLSFIKNLAINSFSIMFDSSVKADSVDTSEYTNYCDDPRIKDEGVAAGPFCNIIYGVPEEYIYKDPIEVINKLKNQTDPFNNSQSQIDDEGNIIEGSSFDIWTSTCMDGSTDSLDECKITKDTANYALYTIDHRIQQSMDGPDTAAVPTVEPVQ